MTDKVISMTRKGIWVLTALSVTSCLIRNDYNVLFCFLILIILDRYFEENRKLFTKVIIHVLSILVATDVFWFIIIMPYWNSTVQNEYWQSLSGMHSFILFVSFLELLLKGAIIGYLVLDFKNNFGDDLMDLTKLNYNSNQDQIKNPIEANKNMNSINPMNSSSQRF